MVGIVGGGAGSGLDINGIVNQLMQVERQPLVAIQKKVSQANTQLSAYGKLRSVISSLKTAMAGMADGTKFKLYSATSTKDTTVTATASSSASPGTHTIEITALAQNHSTRSGLYAGGASSVVGTGTLNVTVGTATLNVNITGANNTLTGIRDAINNASGNNVVSASILNVTGGSYLVLTSRQSGAANAISVSVTGDGDGNDTDAAGLSNLDSANLTQITAAQDAAFKVDALAATSASNTATNVIQGITLNLKATTGVGVTETITVTRDDAKIQEAATAFTKAYNDATKALRDLRGGDLKGDNTVNGIEQQLRTVLNTAASGVGTYAYLAQVGITTGKDGSLGVDAAKFTKALETDFPSVVALFSDGTQGFAKRFFNAADSMLATNGSIQARSDGLSGRVRSLTQQQERVEERMTRIEERYRRQYSMLDQQLGQLRGTSNYLSNQLARI